MIAWIRDRWSNFRERLRARRFQGNAPHREPTAPVLTAELDTLTQQLIQSTVGPHGAITAEFEYQIAQYNKDERPVCQDEARDLMMSLLKVAVAQRNLLNGQIVKNVENGPVFQRYQDQLNEVTYFKELANSQQEIIKSEEVTFDMEQKMYEHFLADSYRQAINPQPSLFERIFSRKRAVAEVPVREASSLLDEEEQEDAE